MLEQDILEKECGLSPIEKKYPTPCARDFRDNYTAVRGKIGTRFEENGLTRVLYKQEILKYPTPCAGNWKDTIGTLKGRIGTPHEENTIARVLYKDEILSYPTPTATNIMGEQSERVERNQSGGFILRKKNKPHMTYGARLQDAVMYLHKQLPKEEQNKILKDKITEMENLKSKPLKSLKMNPDWIEWLMGYPKKWTDITIESKDLEMQLYHKSHTNLEKE
jgi:hypothetical protein